MKHDSRKKRPGLFRRFGSGLLAMALALSLAVPALEQTAYAAGSDRLTISLYDGDTGSRIPQGLGRMESRNILYHDVTDFYRETEHERYSPADPTFIDENGVWNGNPPINTTPDRTHLYVKDNTGVGAGGNAYRLATREEIQNKELQKYVHEIYLKHWGDDPSDNAPAGHKFDTCRIPVDLNGDGHPDVYRWSAECLKNHTANRGRNNTLQIGSRHTGDSVDLIYEGSQLSDRHIYVITEGTNLQASAYCYEPNVYKNDGGFYSEFSWGSGDPYFMGNGATAFTMVKIADADTGAAVQDLPRPSNAKDSTIQLSNQVMRGGFSFSVRDVETGSGALQTMGFAETSVFAVFNISDKALSPDSYKDTDNVSNAGTYPEMKPSVKTDPNKYGLAYVWYQDAYGRHLSEGVKPYSYETVMAAYNSYLQSSNANHYKSGELGIVDYLKSGDTINYYNGMYGYQSGGFDYRPTTALKSGNIRSGLFSLNGKTGADGIWPAAMLMADANGKVTVDSDALPAGNYLVLQVKAPSGYYLDENFRLAVSIGPWYHNYDIDVSTDPDRWGARGVGFGNALFDQISYTARDSGLLAQKTNGFRTLNDYPAVFVPAGAVTDLSDRYGTANFDFGVDKRSGISSSTPTEPDNQVSYNLSNGALRGMGNDGNYIVNASSVGQRRWPHDGYSRVMAYMAPVRGGVSFRLADGDGILRLKSADTSATYDFEGQGDAKLDGVTFRLYNDRAPGHDQNGAFAENALGGSATDSRYGANTGFTSYFGIPGTTGSKGVVNNKDANWENGSQNFKEYTAFKMGTGEYVLNIPVDDMPFGEYTLVQTGSSAGYGDASNDKWAAHIYEELAVAQIRVVSEDKIYVRYGGKGLNAFDVDPVLIQNAIDKYTYKGTTYLPQTVYRDDASVTVSTRDGNDKGISAEITVYNISEHSIMMDGTEIATAKAYYDAGLSGQAVTNMAAVKKMTASDSWARAKIWSGSVSAGTVLTEGLKALPYGTYLVAVTGATGDYAPVGGAAITFQIRLENNKQAGAAVVLADRAAIPDIATVLSDASNGTKSVTMMRAGALTDNVKLSNLQSGVNYVVYGILTDKVTGQMLPGSKIMGANAGAYQGGSGTAVPELELAQLRDIGRMFGEQGKESNDVFASEDYFVWLNRVNNYVKSLQTETGSDAAGYKSSILDLTDRMMSVATGASYRTGTYNSQLTAYLNALTSCFSGSDSLTGTASCEFRYEGLDFTKLEGRTAVAYVFVCEGSELDPKVLGCTTLESARAAMGLALAAEHASVANLEQTVYFPGLDIEAMAKTGGGKKMAATDAVLATISYKNLEPGVTYKISGSLVDMNNTAITDSKGQALKSELEFTAENADGSVVLTFEDLKSGLEGTRLTVHASLSRIQTAGDAIQAVLLITKGDSASMGWSEKDPNPGKNQVDIVKASVSTVLTDASGSKSTDLKAGNVKLRDRVSYTDLIPGQRYTSVLTLFYPNGDPVLDKSGKEVKATAQFTARKSDDTVSIDVSYDGRNLKDKSLIAFNDLRLGGPDGPIVVSEHDLKADSQTVTDAPSSSRFYFQTSVKDDVTGNRYTQLGSAVAITDTVTIQGLDAGEDYTLKTEIADAKSGNVLGQIPVVTTQVKAGETGVISKDIKMSINTTGMSGKSLVVYQTLYNHDGTELIVAHADPTDTAQTLYVPGIDTLATGLDGVSKSVPAEQVEHTEVNVIANPDGTLRTDSKITYTYEAGIQDRIDYVNLSPGNTYTVETRVVAAGGGGDLLKQSTKLSPMESSGSMTVSMTVDVTKALGKSVVVYQTVTDDYSGKIVLQHQDAEDADQTVAILLPGETDGSEDETGTGTGTGNPDGGGSDILDGAVPKGDGAGIQTGVAEHYILFMALGMLFLAITAAGAIYTWKLRRR